MRNQQDLIGAFDSVAPDVVDPDDMLSRIRTGSAARQTARRRLVAAASVAAAAVLIVVGATVLPSLGNDGPDRGQVADTPTPSWGTPPSVARGSGTELGFTVGKPPAGYADDQGIYIDAGRQVLTFHSADLERALVVSLIDLVVTGEAAPASTGETIAINSLSSGPLTVQVLTGDYEGEFPYFQVGWQTDSGLWLTVLSDAPGDLARLQVLTMAAQVDLTTNDPLAFPFQLGYVPDGFEVLGASLFSDAEGRRISNLDLYVPSHSVNVPVGLQISADNGSGSADVVPNTTVGPFDARLEDIGGSFSLVLIDVSGYGITIYVDAEYRDLIDEEDLRRIAGALVVIPGSASDDSVWTEDPIG